MLHCLWFPCRDISLHPHSESPWWTHYFVRLTVAMVNSTLVCAWLLLWWTLLWCVPNCSYGELYSGVCLTAGMVNSTLVCAWLLLWWTLLWCVPNCWYGELYSGVCLTATTMSNEPNCVDYCLPLPHSPNPLSFHALLTSSQLPLCGLHRGLLWCIVTVRSTLILHLNITFCYCPLNLQVKSSLLLVLMHLLPLFSP